MTEERTMSSNDSLLEVVVKVQDKSVSLSEPCFLTVELTNKHNKKIKVNRRMAVGYVDSLSRELYIEIQERQTKQPAKMQVVDYNRASPVPSDYFFLSPGDTLKVTFDLFGMYPLWNSGQYVLTVHYQADEKWLNLPEDIVHGIFSSKPVELHIAP